MKRLLALFLCMLMVLSLVAGCTAAEPPAEEPTGEEPTGEEPTGTGEAPSGEGLKVGLSQQHLTNDWNRGVNAGVISMCEEIGAELVQANAKGDTNQQVADLENFLTLGVDAVIIGGGEGPAFAPVMQEMAKQGIPCITIDIASEYTLSNITSDNFNGGEQLGLYVKNRLSGKGNILVLDTPGWQSLEIRIQMLEAVLKYYPNLKIAQKISIGVQDAVNNYSKETKAYLLGNPDTQAIYCSWGLAAVGAAQAVRELGLQDKIFIVCTDADQVVLEEMRKPDSALTAVVGQYPEKLGSIAVESAVKAAAGEELPVEAYAPIILLEKKDSKAWFSAPAIMSVDEAWDALYSAAQ
jgi:ribose transport system substrate-binding protein